MNEHEKNDLILRQRQEIERLFCELVEAKKKIIALSSGKDKPARHWRQKDEKK